MFTNSKLLTLFLSAIAASTSSAYLRGLEDFDYLHSVRILAPGDNKQCNETDLNTRLADLDQKTECNGQKWTTFRDTISESSFSQSDAGQQTKVVNDFCTTPCGASFNKVVADWREGCHSGAVRRLDPDDDLVPELGDVVLKFGCSKTADDKLCAVLGTKAAEFSEKTWVESDENAVCPFFTSCCFGEMMKLHGEDDTLVTDADVKCPGAEAASTTSCSA